jgi:hypothetical protein
MGGPNGIRERNELRVQKIHEIGEDLRERKCELRKKRNDYTHLETRTFALVIADFGARARS